MKLDRSALRPPTWVLNNKPCPLCGGIVGRMSHHTAVGCLETNCDYTKPATLPKSVARAMRRLRKRTCLRFQQQKEK